MARFKSIVTDAGAATLTALIAAGKPLILTTNLDLSDMLDCQDIRYKRVYDRIFEACYPVAASPPSARTPWRTW